MNSWKTNRSACAAIHFATIVAHGANAFGPLEAISSAEDERSPRVLVTGTGRGYGPHPGVPSVGFVDDGDLALGRLPALSYSLVLTPKTQAENIVMDEEHRPHVVYASTRHGFIDRFLVALPAPLASPFGDAHAVELAWVVANPIGYVTLLDADLRPLHREALPSGSIFRLREADGLWRVRLPWGAVGDGERRWSDSSWR